MNKLLLSLLLVTGFALVAMDVEDVDTGGRGPGGSPSSKLKLGKTPIYKAEEDKFKLRRAAGGSPSKGGYAPDVGEGEDVDVSTSPKTFKCRFGTLTKFSDGKLSFTDNDKRLHKSSSGGLTLRRGILGGFSLDKALTFRNSATDTQINSILSAYPPEEE